MQLRIYKQLVLLTEGRLSIYFASTTKIVISSYEVLRRGNN